MVEKGVWGADFDIGGSVVDAMMEWILIGAVSLVAGITASMGLGGGFILLIYLTVFGGMGQMEAQWVNLLFFLPIGGISFFLHWKNGMIEKGAIVPAILTGILGALVGVWLAGFARDEWLRKGFAIFLLLVGLREIFSKAKDETKPPNLNAKR